MRRTKLARASALAARLSAKRFVRDRSATTAIEYAFIAGLVGVAIVAAVTLVGTNLNALFVKVGQGFGS